MKKFYTIAFLTALFSIATSYAQLNLSLLGQLDYPVDLSNLWGWSDGAGHEYAIVGTEEGTSIVDITDPTAPTEVQFVDGINSIWREVRTWSHYAYVVTEGGGGLLCIDLSGLPGPVTYNFTDAGIGLSSGHTVFCDENGIVHVFGSNLYSGGDVMLDANADPLHPTYVGKVNEWYIHDGFVRGDTLWAANIYDGWFSVWDVSDKTTPVLIGQQSTPSTFTHNVAVTPDNHYIYTTDEVSGAPVASYDVSDLTDIKALDEFQSVPGTDVIPHNTYVVGNFLVTSYYTDGVIIADATHPDNIIKTGWYDTSPAYSGGTFNGDWGVCASLPSGVIIASDIENGLFVLQPTYIQACYLEGNVTDALSGSALYDVAISITLSPEAATSTDLSGNYETGMAAAGSYDVTFMKSGYAPVTITGVSMSNGITTTLDVEMEALTPFTLSGLVVDASSGLPVPNASVHLISGVTSYETVSDASGNFSIPGTFPDTYTIYAGQWGYLTTVTSPTYIGTPDLLTVTLNRGYYDDFLFINNWNVASTSSSGYWTRDIPTGTFSGSDYANPNVDVGDDYGDYCFMTGNGGGGAGDDDVDDGYTILTSPVMDLSTYANPHIFYDRWFYDGSGGGFPNDSLRVYLSNGITTVQVDEIHNLGLESQWVSKEIVVKDYIDLTDNMHIIFRTADQVVTGNVVEAGIDKFYVSDTYTSAPTAAFEADNANACTPTTIHFNDLTTDGVTSWSWSFPGGTPATSALENPAITYSTPGVYDVSLTSTNPLGSNTLLLPGYLTLAEAPTISLTATFGSATVSISGGAPPYSVSWDDPSHQTTETAVDLPNGNYTVEVTDANGCVVSDSIAVNGDAVTDNMQVSLAVYPNPFTNFCSLTLPSLPEGGNYILEITDVTGKVLMQQSVHSGTNVLNAGDKLSAGIYLMNLKKDGELLGRKKIIKITE